MRKISCGCCTGPAEDQCVCHMHQDTPRGNPPRKCTHHLLEELVNIVHAQGYRCCNNVPLTPLNNPCPCTQHADYHAALRRLREKEER